MNDLFRLKKCFESLERQNAGFSAKLNFMCCGSCGHAAMGSPDKGQWIFAHEQSMESCFGKGYGPSGTSEDRDDMEDLPMQGILYLQHHLTSEPLKQRIVESIRHAGFRVEWDFSDIKCIGVNSY